MSEAVLPTWPTTTFETPEDAIVEAMLNSDTGDLIFVHAGSCASAVDADCDCTPQVITVPDEVRT